MSTYIDAALELKLSRHSEKAIKKAQTKAEVAERASTVAGDLMFGTAAGAQRYLRENSARASDEQRLEARVFTAGVLSLIGRKDTNFAHSRTAAVVLAKNIMAGGLRYSQVGARLLDVTIDPDIGTITAETWNPKVVAPSDIKEATASITATPHGRQEPALVDMFSGWLAEEEMPAHYDPRRDARQPRYIGHQAITMLKAMQVPALNPEFRTLEFVKGVSSDLAEQVADVERPLAAIDTALYLPAWMPDAA